MHKYSTQIEKFGDDNGWRSLNVFLSVSYKVLPISYGMPIPGPSAGWVQLVWNNDSHHQFWIKLKSMLWVSQQDNNILHFIPPIAGYFCCKEKKDIH